MTMRSPARTVVRDTSNAGQSGDIPSTRRTTRFRKARSSPSPSGAPHAPSIVVEGVLDRGACAQSHHERGMRAESPTWATSSSPSAAAAVTQVSTPASCLCADRRTPELPRSPGDLSQSASTSSCPASMARRSAGATSTEAASGLAPRAERPRAAASGVRTLVFVVAGGDHSEKTLHGACCNRGQSHAVRVAPPVSRRRAARGASQARSRQRPRGSSRSPKARRRRTPVSDASRMELGHLIRELRHCVDLRAKGCHRGNSLTCPQAQCTSRGGETMRCLTPRGSRCSSRSAAASLFRSARRMVTQDGAAPRAGSSRQHPELPAIPQSAGEDGGEHDCEEHDGQRGQDPKARTSAAPARRGQRAHRFRIALGL